ncbi:MAG: hypothetical protein DI586_01560 [Micavibrio aeruginosavorus]|uniref:HTH luxR-type domain-containing protein n=1 Tax=Micavibrio aeruginosavorus TaxID=349221 RepID=A0A2W5HTV2_9BACT|nr:MAG: hypothetical protein DI586_01560 [Micavibrio aeruginosavorus]
MSVTIFFFQLLRALIYLYWGIIMAQHFENYVSLANKAKDKDELNQILLRFTANHGFDKVILCFDTDHAHINIDAGVSITGNFCPDFISYYKAHNYSKVDPVLARARLDYNAFEWKETVKDPDLTKQQRSIVYECNEAGHNDGVYVPIMRYNGLAGVGLARSQKDTDLKIDLDILTAYCNHFYDSFVRLHSDANRKSGIFKNPLTRKEIEILKWAAEGKTDHAIGEKMFISDATVETHLRHIYTKLKVPNRTAAVAIALSRRFINLS